MAEHSTELGHCILLINTTASWPTKQGLTHRGNDGDQVSPLHEDRGRITKGSRPPREEGCFPMSHSLVPWKGQFFFIIKLKFPACEKIYGCFKKRRASSFFTPFNFPPETTADPRRSPFSLPSPLQFTWYDKPLCLLHGLLFLCAFLPTSLHWLGSDSFPLLGSHNDPFCIFPI
jgi:hypothetical protein